MPIKSHYKNNNQNNNDDLYKIEKYKANDCKNLIVEEVLDYIKNNIYLLDKELDIEIILFKIKNKCFAKGEITKILEKLYK